MANLIPIKILILGNSGVGKTSLCNRYVKDNYLEAYRPTIGVELCSKNIVSPWGRNEFKFQFWDICGQESYLSMSNMYYKNANFCLIMFDLMDLESFRACAKWKRDLDEKYRMANGEKCPCLLIGNKNDMPTRVLDQFDIEDFCREYEIDGYIETSVKKNIMVKETIDYVAKALIKKKEFDLAKEATTTMTTTTRMTTSSGSTISSAYSSSSSSPRKTSSSSNSLTRLNTNEFMLDSKRDFTNQDDKNNNDTGENLACYPLMLFFLFVTALFVIKRIVLTILFKSHTKSLWK